MEGGSGYVRCPPHGAMVKKSENGRVCVQILEIRFGLHLRLAVWSGSSYSSGSHFLPLQNKDHEKLKKNEILKLNLTKYMNYLMLTITKH